MIESHEKENVRHHDPGSREAFQELKAKPTPKISPQYPSVEREQCFRGAGPVIGQDQVPTKARKGGLSELPRMTDHRLQHTRVRISNLASGRKGDVLDVVQIIVPA